MLVIPQLGRDEELMTWDATFLDGFANGFLGEISGLSRRH